MSNRRYQLDEIELQKMNIRLAVHHPSPLRRRLA